LVPVAQDSIDEAAIHTAIRDIKDFRVDLATLLPTVVAADLVTDLSKETQEPREAAYN
jgi:glycerol-3-phosphate responsive antiterminator